MKIKKLEVQVRKAVDNDLSVYETFYNNSAKYKKNLSSICKNPQVPIMF